MAEEALTGHGSDPRLLRKALLLLSGNATAALLSLVRNLLLARMLPIEDFGIAATLATTLAVTEMASALGLHQQIVQAKDGDDPRFQAAVQGFHLLRAVVSALTLLAIAHPLAGFLGVPEIAWAYQTLAIIPILGGLCHFDIHRMQRQMSYGPLMLASVLPVALSLALVWPLVAWLGDWRAMLGTMLVQAAAGFVLTHVLAERRYQLVFDRAIMARNLSFGLPLLFDAALIFLVFHGDKLIVGRELGMAALGIFAMGVTLTLTPTLVMSRSAMSFFLPRLSVADRATAEGEARFQHLSRAAYEVHFAFGSALVLGVMILGAPFIAIVLGPKFDPLVPLLTLLAVMQGLRVFKGGPAIIALSRAQTGNSAIANLARIALLPVAWVVADRTGRIDLVVAIGILGEFLGFVVASWLVRRRAGLSLRRMGLPVALSLALFLVAASTVAFGVPLVWAVPVACALFAVQVWRMWRPLAEMTRM